MIFKKRTAEETESLAKEIANYITKAGTENTTTGNYHFDFDEINDIFDTVFPVEEEKLYEAILDSVDYKIVSEIDIADDFDLCFYTKYCTSIPEDEAVRISEWNAYLTYLKDWVETHAGAEFYGMSPVCFDEWYGEENEEDEDDE